MPQLLDTQTPFVSYKRTILEDLPEDILKEISPTSLADEGIIEPPPYQSPDNHNNPIDNPIDNPINNPINNPDEELTACSDICN